MVVAVVAAVVVVMAGQTQLIQKMAKNAKAVVQNLVLTEYHEARY